VGPCPRHLSTIACRQGPRCSSTLASRQSNEKYAAASDVTVCLHQDASHVRVEVTDDGCGFDVSNAPRGAGLMNMEDRLDALGGTLQIESTLGVGRRSVPHSQSRPPCAPSTDPTGPPSESGANSA
jgi:hypothetical protein